MPKKAQDSQGIVHTFPDDATDAEILDALGSKTNFPNLGVNPHDIPNPPTQGYEPRPGLIPHMESVPNVAEWAAGKLPAAKTAGQTLKKAALSTGKAAVDAMSDPVVAGSTVGGMVGGAVGGVPGAFIGAGAGGGLARLGKESYDAYTEKRQIQQPDWKMLEGAATGVAGEGMARLIPAVPLRREMDPLGREVAGFFGKDVSAHQLTDSAPLNFVGTIAKYGMGGQRIMREQAERQSGRAIETIQREAEKIAPPGLSQLAKAGQLPTPPRGSVNFQKDDAGKAVQNALASELKGAKSASNMRYTNWLDQYGQFQRLDPESGEPLSKPISQLHDERVHALKASRSAQARMDEIAQADALKKASGIRQEMTGVLNETQQRDAMDEYSTIAGLHKADSQRLNNPTLKDLRRKTKADDVIKKVLESQLQTHTPMGEEVALSNSELLDNLQRALPKPQFDQMRADTLYTVMHDAINPETGILEHQKLAEIVQKLDDDVRTKLFGPKADQQLTRIMSILGRTQGKQQIGGESGRLFIAIRYGSAALGLGGEALAYATGHAANPGAIAGSASIILSPYIFAKVLTSDVGRAALVRAGTARGPARVAAVKALQRFATNAASEKVVDTIDSSDTSLPAPPQQ